MLNRFKFKVQKLNMNFDFTLQEVEKKYNTCYHVLNPVGVNGGGGSRTHDTQITRRTLSERGYGGYDKEESSDMSRDYACKL